MGLIGMIGAAAAMLAAAPATPAGKPVEVMVLGTYHFGNPGQDLNNVEADDVTAPKRQAELQALADALARFRPTKIMVERVAKTPDLVDPNYASFTPATLRKTRDERVQIGYRLARQLNLPTVYAIDEQPGAGEPDYFPFGKVAAFANANGQSGQLEATMAEGAAYVRSIGEGQKTKSIGALLAEVNAPSATGGISSYYELLKVGGVEEQPGAELNAMWYLRNAKIFGKLMTVVKPGDRVLVVYGNGHNYWLRHLASETRGYRNVDPVPYLKAAARR
jgi:hypothetical protein